MSKLKMWIRAHGGTLARGIPRPSGIQGGIVWLTKDINIFFSRDKLECAQACAQDEDCEVFEFQWDDFLGELFTVNMLIANPNDSRDFSCRLGIKKTCLSKTSTEMSTVYMNVGAKSFLDIPSWLQETFADDSCEANHDTTTTTTTTTISVSSTE